MDRLSIGVGMIPRGEVGLIFASIGKAPKVVDAATFSAVVTMIIVTTLITPPLLSYTLSRQSPVSRFYWRLATDDCFQVSLKEISTISSLPISSSSLRSSEMTQVSGICSLAKALNMVSPDIGALEHSVSSSSTLML
jgi:hypothetical protein